MQFITGKDSQYTEPVMLVLCLMLSGTYYSQNYTSIIGWYLTLINYTLYCLDRLFASGLFEVVLSTT